MYDLASLNAALAGSIFAGKLRYSASTGSTNDDAKSAACNAALHGSVFLANEQTAGRGRGDHAWHSSAGEGLYVSVLLRPQIPPARLTLLPLVAGLAAAAAIRAATRLIVDLRWPNDLLIGPRKTGGILVESHIEAGAGAIASSGISSNWSSALGWSVVGIGINVHQRSFAPDLATPATSLDHESGARISRQPLLIALLEWLERGVNALADATAARMIPEQVERASSWVRGRLVEVHGPQACTGITEGLDESGFLRVRTAAGLVTITTGGLRDDLAKSF
jgi:BirA family transcriptional regulator, biotin operon repressor / biotin---[acetyl-CoA-carboxylase] ligase